MSLVVSVCPLELFTRLMLYFCLEPDLTGCCILVYHQDLIPMLKSSRYNLNVNSSQCCAANSIMSSLKEYKYFCQYCQLNNCVTVCLQVDLCPEEMGNNVRPAVALLGDLSSIVTQVS